MAKARIDRRVERTCESLRVALRELIAEKRFDAITVQDVLDRANVGRSTFYAHYRCKEDLFRSDVERFLGFLEKGIGGRSGAAERILPVRELFAHVREFRAFCGGLAASGMMEPLQRTIAGRIAARLEKTFPAAVSAARKRTVPVPLLAAHVAGTLVNLLDWWLRNGMRQTPEQMDAAFHALVGPALAAPAS